MSRSGNRVGDPAPVGLGVTDVAGARIGVGPLERMPQDLLEEVDELEEGDPGAEGQVDRTRGGHRSDDGVGQDPAHGADVGEVPGLGPVAVHREGLATEGAGDEGGHHGGIGVVRRPAAGRRR